MYAFSGVVNIKTFLDKFSDVKRDARDHSFIAVFPMCDIGSQRQEDLSALLMVTGYIAKKTMLRMTCEACKHKFGNRELQQLNLEIDYDLLMYFESINRGGLTYPSNFLFNVIQCAYNVFNVCISKYEKKFLKVVNQKQTLLGLFEKHKTDYKCHAVTELFRQHTLEKLQYQQIRVYIRRENRKESFKVSCEIYELHNIMSGL